MSRCSLSLAIEKIDHLAAKYGSGMIFNLYIPGENTSIKAVYDSLGILFKIAKFNCYNIYFSNFIYRSMNSKNGFGIYDFLYYAAMSDLKISLIINRDGNTTVDGKNIAEINSYFDDIKKNSEENLSYKIKISDAINQIDFWIDKKINGVAILEKTEDGYNIIKHISKCLREHNENYTVTEFEHPIKKEKYMSLYRNIYHNGIPSDLGEQLNEHKFITVANAIDKGLVIAPIFTTQSSNEITIQNYAQFINIALDNNGDKVKIDATSEDGDWFIFERVDEYMFHMTPHMHNDTVKSHIYMEKYADCNGIIDITNAVIMVIRNNMRLNVRKD